MVLEIEGGNKLEGTYVVQSAKNAVLPILAGSILTGDKVKILDCPNILDVDNMVKILLNLGSNVVRVGKNIEVYGEINKVEVNSELSSLLRSSIFLLGSILSVKKKAVIAYPGGCDIGLRPIDIHIRGLKELGVKIVEEFGYIFCDATNMKPADILLDLPSVGATENLIMASVFLQGKTVLRNVAKEPEIVDLVRFLNAMGAKITGEGTAVITVEGVKSLHGCTYKPIGDRIVAGTILLATATCGGEVEIKNIEKEYIYSLIAKFAKNYCKLYSSYDKIILKSYGEIKAIDQIETSYYPGFPTDMQAQFMGAMLTAKGTSVIVENLFETRFKQVPEFIKMGADIKVSGKTAVIKGVNKLYGADVYAKDLRGGAGLVIAGLKAEGVTRIFDINHIDRGYENIETTFQNLGANIKRIYE